MRRIFLAAAMVTAALAAAAPATAGPVIVNQSNCSATTPNPDAIACSGFWTSNLLNNSQDALSAQHAALAQLGYNFDTGTFNTLTSGSLSGGLLGFGQTLYGITYIGVHFGDASTGLGDRTVFYEFNFGTSGNTGIALNTNGFSNAILYATGLSGVPEPATWAMMLIGLLGTGVALRYRRRPATLA